jgi:hypothetical protein
MSQLFGIGESDMQNNYFQVGLQTNLKNADSAI